MKYLLALVIPLLALSTQGVSQGKAPIMILETTGNVKAKPADGGCFKKVNLKPGSALLEDSKLILKNNSSVLVLQDGVFQRYAEKGNYTLNPSPEGVTRVAKRNFDPLFAQFIASSYRVTLNGIISGIWQIGTKKRGDGWGGSDPNSVGGWGGSDPNSVGGWGKDDPSVLPGWGGSDPNSVGGWGGGNTNSAGDWGGGDPGSVGGWGGSDPNSVGGWGKDDPRNGDGWGVTPHMFSGWGGSDPNSVGGWGGSDPSSVGGWGTTDPTKLADWGGSDPNSVGGWGGSDPNSVGGWGASEMNIKPLVPGGQYEAKKMKASWIAQDDVDKYLVCVIDGDYNLVSKKETTSNSAEFDLSDLSTEKRYYWQVYAYNKRSVSPPISFNIADSELTEEIKDITSNSDIYATAGPALRGMMEAVAYETTGMLKAAYDTYETLFKRYSDNDLLRMQYATFCLRNGQYMKAKEIAEGM